MIKTLMLIMSLAIPAATGHLFALKQEYGVKRITEIKNITDLMYARIKYYREPFAEALKKITKSTGILTTAAEEINKYTMSKCSASEAARYAIEAENRRLSIYMRYGKGEMDAFCRLAEFVSGDKNSMECGFEVVKKELQAKLDEAAAESKRRAKLYRTAGILTGTLLFILLF